MILCKLNSGDLVILCKFRYNIRINKGAYRQFIIINCGWGNLMMKGVVDSFT